MATLEQFEKNWKRVRETPEETIIGIFKRVLSSATKQAILEDLAPHIEVARDVWQQEIDDGIRAQATKLDADDPLRIAIEGVDPPE